MSAAGSVGGSAASSPPPSGSSSPQRGASGSDSEEGALVGAPAAAASPVSEAPSAAADNSSEAAGASCEDADFDDLANAIVAASAEAAASGLELADQVAEAASPRASQGAAVLEHQGSGYLDAPSGAGRKSTGSGCSRSCCVTAAAPCPPWGLMPVSPVRLRPLPTWLRLKPVFGRRRSASDRHSARLSLPLRLGRRLTACPRLAWSVPPRLVGPRRLRRSAEKQYVGRRRLRASPPSKRWKPRKRHGRRLPRI
ncbi:hypothetical protein Esi_0075_0073 [Ectocarpus siliculosus]|uniref:Uncharacterized protein n=1 Tax=Ectocarpus siliculosus TaxID=2880 RepID=D7G6K0_ECTSI|nr:hypothetical protein Esi_0075_0073 [Ectocarpus siliculosus]|eukprot:CBJ27585.1 hypothetical protein Esi_0075_0073 [Ectocarpus siliculosus]